MNLDRQVTVFRPRSDVDLLRWGSKPITWGGQTVTTRSDSIAADIYDEHFVDEWIQLGTFPCRLDLDSPSRAGMTAADSAPTRQVQSATIRYPASANVRDEDRVEISGLEGRWHVRTASPTLLGTLARAKLTLLQPDQRSAPKARK